jgi:hypothetical protein
MFGTGKRAADNKDEGQRLFELGMKAAVEFRSNEAIELYGRSIRASDNPSPYINRANLLGKRVRHFEALQDLLRAQQLDRSQGRQFGVTIAREIATTSALAEFYSNGMQPKLVADLKARGYDYVVGRLITESFKIPAIRWEHRMAADSMLEFHLFNDLDNIIKFDDIDAYPEAQELARLYPAEFIELKLAHCPDFDAYSEHEAILHRFLCSYPLDQMRRIRRLMIYEIHEQLLIRDFDDVHSLSSSCNGITREAEEFISVLGGTTKSESGKNPHASASTKADQPALGTVMTVGGVSISKRPESQEELLDLVHRVAPEIAKRVPTEQDFYWFLIEQYDRLRGKSDYFDELLDHVGLHPIEYKGMKSEESYVGQPNPGVVFFRDEITKPLSNLYDEDGLGYVTTALFTGFCGIYASGVTALRRKYATHYHNNCVSQGNYNSADRWVAVLDAL